MITDLILRGDYERSVDQLLELEFLCADSIIRFASVLLQARLYELSDKRNTSIRVLERFALRNGQSAGSMNRVLVAEQVRLFVAEGHFDPALKLVEGTKEHPSILQLSREYLALQAQGAPPSAYAAASLVPGLGQVMMGEYLSAVSSVLMIAIPTVFALQARASGERAFELASWTISGFFYLGNVSSAYQLASLKRKNQVTEIWKEKVASAFERAPVSELMRAGMSSEVVDHLYPKFSGRNR